MPSRGVLRGVEPVAMLLPLTLWAFASVSAQALPCERDTGAHIRLLQPSATFFFPKLGFAPLEKQEAGQEVTHSLRSLLQDAQHELEVKLEECENCDELDEALFDAAKSGDSEKVKELLSEGADESDSLALHTAAQSGHADVVKILVDAGADVNARIPSGHPPHVGLTPVYLAALEGHLDVVELLIEEGADVDVMFDGVGPLHAAAFFGHLDVAQALIDAGADVNSRDDTTKVTPLMTAILHSGDPKMVQLLVDNGAKIDIRSGDGQTALMVASMLGNDEAAKVLLEAGANPDILDNAGNRASNIICACTRSTIDLSCAQGKCGSGENKRLARLLEDAPSQTDFSISKSPKAALLVSGVIFLVLL